MRDLPNRRPCSNKRIPWGERHFTVSVGYDPSTGDVLEVFYSDGMKSGTDLLHTCQDACILVSLLLQAGVPIEDIRKSLSGQSVVAAIVAAITE